MSGKANFGVDPKLTAILGETYTSTERALCELVDNSWDADAENVWVTLPEPMTDDPIIVVDDGTGMTNAEVRDIYLKIANDRLSRSADDRTHAKKRLIKGRKGIGKFAGLAAAKIMQLDTVARGTLTRLTIHKDRLLDARGRRDLEMVDLPLTDEKASSNEHGTTVTLTELDQSKSFPLPETLKRLLTREYGREEGFNVFVNGESLSVTDLGGQVKETRFSHADVGPVVVRWTITDKPLPKSEAGFVYRVGGKVIGRPTFCGLEEEEDIPEKVRNRVYGEIEADGLDKHVTADWGEIIENSLPLQAIKREVCRRASEHVREVCKTEVNMARARLALECKRRIETLPEHRRQYATEAVERVIQKFFPEGDEKVRLLVGLVLDALEKDEYYRVCENLANARGSDVATIAECLAEFGLVDIAVTAHQARHRTDVLNQIEALVRNEDTLESEVHTAFEHNLWILGPQYALIASNKTLENIIADYCDKKFTGARAKKRPDLFLGQSASQRKLLIEFKRPSGKVGRDAEAQVKKYRDDLTPSHGAMDVLVLGGSVDRSMSAAYATSDIAFRAYTSVIAEARTQMEWLLKELTTR
ncbi:MAG: ATP-binding protein [Phycisphaerae bacterium]|jgi:hypothetical protein